MSFAVIALLCGGLFGPVVERVLHYETPIPIPVSDAQIISGECGGNGRQIVRCRDISTGAAAAPDTGHGKPLLNGLGAYWRD
jgi:hypothetical protein